jgi:hypothetical protein
LHTVSRDPGVDYSKPRVSAEEACQSALYNGYRRTASEKVNIDAITGEPPVGIISSVERGRLSSDPGNVRSLPQLAAGPSESAIFAPRAPIAFGAPVVVSRAVWCSISASSSAPSRTTMAEIHSHVMNPITAPKDP